MSVDGSTTSTSGKEELASAAKATWGDASRVIIFTDTEVLYSTFDVGSYGVGGALKCCPPAPAGPAACLAAGRVREGWQASPPPCPLQSIPAPLLSTPPNLRSPPPLRGRS